MPRDEVSGFAGRVYQKSHDLRSFRPSLVSGGAARELKLYRLIAEPMVMAIRVVSGRHYQL